MQAESDVKSKGGFLWWLDRGISLIGVASGYLVLPLVAVVVTEVFSRYVLQSPTIWAWEMSRFFGGSMFVLALGYVYLMDAHVRVDLLYTRWSPRTRAIVNVVCVLLFVFPVLIPSLRVMINTTVLSWQTGEVSSDSAWRVPIYPFKTVMPVATILLLLSVASKFVRDVKIAVIGEGKND